jgi:hypothetical protein
MVQRAMNRAERTSAWAQVFRRVQFRARGVAAA